MDILAHSAVDSLGPPTRSPSKAFKAIVQHSGDVGMEREETVSCIAEPNPSTWSSFACQASMLVAGARADAVANENRWMDAILIVVVVVFVVVTRQVIENEFLCPKKKSGNYGTLTCEFRTCLIYKEGPLCRLGFIFVVVGGFTPHL